MLCKSKVLHGWPCSHKSVGSLNYRLATRCLSRGQRTTTVANSCNVFCYWYGRRRRCWMTRIIASVCFSARIMLNKLAATEDIFCIQIRTPSAAPSVALTCVLLLCFFPLRFITLLSVQWGESQGLTRRDCKYRSENRAVRQMRALQPNPFHFVY